MECFKCGKQTDNPKFCSRSCSASYTNKMSPKRKKKQHFCKYCGIPVDGRKTTCPEHNINNIDWSIITLRELTDKRSYQKNGRIRELARFKFKNKELKCLICGYNTHVEICHKKSISSFSSDTPISVINSDDNLVCLCPNHHWEFDNGIISL